VLPRFIVTPVSRTGKPTGILRPNPVVDPVAVLAARRTLCQKTRRDPLIIQQLPLRARRGKPTVEERQGGTLFRNRELAPARIVSCPCGNAKRGMNPCVHVSVRQAFSWLRRFWPAVAAAIAASSTRVPRPPARRPAVRRPHRWSPARPAMSRSRGWYSRPRRFRKASATGRCIVSPPPRRNDTAAERQNLRQSSPGSRLCPAAASRRAFNRLILSACSLSPYRAASPDWQDMIISG
jgi:hypothetical protein